VVTTAGLAALRGAIASCHGAKLTGHVVAVSALSVDIAGLAGQLSIGDRLSLHARNGTIVAAEIIAVRGNVLQAAPFGATLGIGAGAPAHAPAGEAQPRGSLHPSDSWLGRVIDPLGLPLDGLGALPPGPVSMAVRAGPPAATLRARLGPPIDLGVRVLNAFTTCRTGQRLGLFAGSGVGKSTLLSMLARYTACDVAVLALVGERGREVRDFLEDDLGAEGLARAVVVVATSDAMTVAEYFRDQGKSVLLLMDSVTRFCLALRELGLAAGEPPATRGYPPSVFAELPRLLERAGPGPTLAGGGAGHITALFTVLVEGSDHDEPVADAVRGILDGHVILDRRIGEAGGIPRWMCCGACRGRHLAY
jgi:flagellum-specific ATP synthase